MGRLRGTCLVQQSGGSLVSYHAAVHPLLPTYPTKRPGFPGSHYGGRAIYKLVAGVHTVDGSACPLPVGPPEGSPQALV